MRAGFHGLRRFATSPVATLLGPFGAGTRAGFHGLRRFATSPVATLLGPFGAGTRAYFGAGTITPVAAEMRGSCGAEARALSGTDTLARFRPGPIASYSAESPPFETETIVERQRH